MRSGGKRERNRLSVADGQGTRVGDETLNTPIDAGRPTFPWDKSQPPVFMVPRCCSAGYTHPGRKGAVRRVWGIAAKFYPRPPN